MAANLESAASVESVSTIAGGAGLSLTSTGTEGENVGRVQVRLAEGAGPGAEERAAGLVREALEGLPEVRFKFERPHLLQLPHPDRGRGLLAIASTSCTGRRRARPTA